MRATLRKWRLLSLVGSVFVAALSTQPALAKFEDYLTKRWFTIEVIVFERSNINDKNTLEALAHPRPAPDVDVDVDTELLGTSDDSTSASATLSASDPDALLVDDDAFSSVRELTPQRLALETPVPETDQTPAGPINQGPINQGSMNQGLMDPGPSKEAIRLDFLQAINAYELELESRNLIFQVDANPRLEEELQRLARPRNHTIVWRGHWLQAVPNRDEPQPLNVAVNELESGEFQLSGSLEVTVSRYLHLHAQLWYHDPAFGDALMSEELAGFGPGQSPNRLGRTMTPPTSATTPTVVSTAGLRASSSRFDDREVGTERGEQALMEQPWPEPLFMVLDETRRMRSGFLHYLDHPKLGLLVRIDKLTVPAKLLAQYKLFEASQK